METGFDVLAHAVESYISKAATPYTDIQSEHAIQIVGKYLPRLARNLKDVEAREKMSFASMIMGINLGNSSTCLPHRLQYPLGAHTDTSHGQGLAALFPAWMTCEYKYADDKVKRVMQLLANADCRCEADVESVIKRFIADAGLTVSLREMGIVEEILEQMTDEVTGNIQNDPAAQEEEIIRKLYRMAY